MHVPKGAGNIGNPRGRVHGWSRAHIVLINNNYDRPKTRRSFDLERDLDDERGEDSSLKTFCNRATVFLRYLTYEHEAKGMQTLWKSSPIQKELMELVQGVPLVCI